MANTSDISVTCSKLRKMTLTNNSHDNDSHGNKNSVSLDQAPVSNIDSGQTGNGDNFSHFTFDNVIGHLEDMLIDEDFHSLQNSFLEKYWEEFEDSEENKHSYMTIFKEYTNKIEDFIVDYLKERISNFDMEVFARELEKRKNTLEGEIYEVLLTLSDFSAFKEIFLDYRAMKEGTTIDLSSSLCVSSVPY